MICPPNAAAWYVYGGNMKQGQPTSEARHPPRRRHATLSSAATATADAEGPDMSTGPAPRIFTGVGPRCTIKPPNLHNMSALVRMRRDQEVRRPDQMASRTTALIYAIANEDNLLDTLRTCMPKDVSSCLCCLDHLPHFLLRCPRAAMRILLAYRERHGAEQSATDWLNHAHALRVLELTKAWKEGLFRPPPPSPPSDVHPTPRHSTHTRRGEARSGVASVASSPSAPPPPSSSLPKTVTVKRERCDPPKRTWRTQARVSLRVGPRSKAAKRPRPAASSDTRTTAGSIHTHKRPRV